MAVAAATWAAEQRHAPRRAPQARSATAAGPAAAISWAGLARRLATVVERAAHRGGDFAVDALSEPAPLHAGPGRALAPARLMERGRLARRCRRRAGGRAPGDARASAARAGARHRAHVRSPSARDAAGARRLCEHRTFARRAAAARRRRSGGRVVGARARARDASRRTSPCPSAAARRHGHHRGATPRRPRPR